MKNKKNTNKGMVLLVALVFTLSLVTLTGLVSAAAPVIYTDSTEYLLDPAHVHTYDNPNNFITSATVTVKNNADVYATFNYAEGGSYSTPAQRSTTGYVEHTFINPNSTKVVSSIKLTASTGIYAKDFVAYGYTSLGDWSANLPSQGSDEVINPSCGNGIKEGTEECDKGESNGQSCTPGYGSSCTYCTSSCKSKTVRGEYCGDGKLNSEFEKCDDGNTYDGDGCSSECKKPFQVTVEDFPPIVFGCDHRVVYDDATEPGRISAPGQELIERLNNYAFEGEQIQWKVLVMDKNGIEKVKDVYITVDEEKQANCKRLNDYFGQNTVENTQDIISPMNSVGGSIGIGDTTEDGGSPSESDGEYSIDSTCNARILEEKITTFNPETMAYYLCTLTVESPDTGMVGEVDMTVEAEDLDEVFGTMDETETWYLNPGIELSLDGDISFDEVRPGTSAYSGRVLVGNNADYGSGVRLDMFISGTDFYDSSPSGAKCPTTNQLKLENFRYYATSGAYSTHQDSRADAEGYVPIEYGTGFNDPKPFYNRNEILQVNNMGGYYQANTLTTGAEMSIIFRLNLPEPCNGDFDTGDIYFWGEAI
jgi:cysteine-rich repeat protein